MGLSERRVKKNHYARLAECGCRMKKHLQVTAASAAHHGVSRQQYAGLLALAVSRRREGMTVDELAEQMGRSKRGAVTLVQALEALRLVKQIAATTERRHARVQLTAKGRNVMVKLLRAQRPQLGSTSGSIGAARQSPSAKIPPRKNFASPACSMPEIED